MQNRRGGGGGLVDIQNATAKLQEARFMLLHDKNPAMLGLHMECCIKLSCFCSGGLPFNTQRGEDLVLDRKHARRNNAAGTFFPSEYDLMGGSKHWARADSFERPLARGSSRIDMDLRNRTGRDESSQGAQHGRRLAPRDLVHRDFRGRDAREEEGLHSRMEASNRDFMKTLARHQSAGDSEILQNLRRLQPEAFGSIQSLKELDPLLSARQSLDAVAELDPQNLLACSEDETQIPPH